MIKHTFIKTLITLLLAVNVLNISLAQQVCETYTTNDVPDARYIVHDNATVTDKLTGLMWAKCTVGRSGVDCATGDDEKFNWNDALQTAESSQYSDYQDWRLPNVDEYRSLANYSCRNPSINLNIFPNVQANNNFYWTAEIKVRGGEDNIAFLFDYLDGIQNANFRTGLAKVMLVRNPVP